MSSDLQPKPKNAYRRAWVNEEPVDVKFVLFSSQTDSPDIPSRMARSWNIKASLNHPTTTTSMLDCSREVLTVKGRVWFSWGPCRSTFRSTCPQNSVPGLLRIIQVLLGKQEASIQSDVLNDSTPCSGRDFHRMDTKRACLPCTSRIGGSNPASTQFERGFPPNDTWLLADWHSQIFHSRRLCPVIG